MCVVLGGWIFTCTYSVYQTVCGILVTEGTHAVSITFFWGVVIDDLGTSGGGEARDVVEAGG